MGPHGSLSPGNVTVLMFRNMLSSWILLSDSCQLQDLCPLGLHHSKPFSLLLIPTAPRWYSSPYLDSRCNFRLVPVLPPCSNLPLIALFLKVDLHCGPLGKAFPSLVPLLSPSLPSLSLLDHRPNLVWWTLSQAAVNWEKASPFIFTLCSLRAKYQLGITFQ